MEKFCDITIYFMIFSITGWLCETIYCTIKDKKFAYRGFLNGPWTPIYGFGGVLVVYLLVPFKDFPPMLFLVGMLATTALEYFSSFIMEVIFDMKWWDYTDVSFNLNGRVCLWYSIMFGALSLVAVYWMYPPFEQIFLSIKYAHKLVIAITFLVIFMADVLITVYLLFALNNTLKGLQESRTMLLKALGEVESNDDKTLTATLATFKENYVPIEQIIKTAQDSLSPQQKELVEKFSQKEDRFKMLGLHRFHLKRILQAFPSIQSKKYQYSLIELKNRVKTIKYRRIEK